MMIFEPKMSGTSVKGWKCEKRLFDSQFIELHDVMEKVQRQETMNFILDNLRFYKGEGDNGEPVWYAIIDNDSIMKLSILEYCPEDEAELKEYFGEEWLKHYIRFGH